MNFVSASHIYFQLDALEGATQTIALSAYVDVSICLCSCIPCRRVQDAHDGSLTSLYFFPGEPLLMSAAADNSLKHWLFDSADGTARLLRFRSGHSAPPSCLKFYGTGNKLLSAGKTRTD